MKNDVSVRERKNMISPSVSVWEVHSNLENTV